MKTFEEAKRQAVLFAAYFKEPFHVLRTDDDYFGPYAVVDNGDLDSYFCGAQPEDIIFSTEEEDEQ